MTSHYAFLVVEDDALTARALARRLGYLGKVVVAPTLERARQCLKEGPGTETGRWTGAIVDVMLPDGQGTDFAAQLRELEPPVPTLVLTGHSERSVINVAQVLGAEFALKPPDEPTLVAFVSRCLLTPGQAGGDDGTILTRATRSYGLTVREAAVLAHALQGRDRDVSARALGMSEGTIKTHIGAILRKTGSDTIRTVVAKLREPPPSSVRLAPVPPVKPGAPQTDELGAHELRGNTRHPLRVAS